MKRWSLTDILIAAALFAALLAWGPLSSRLFPLPPAPRLAVAATNVAPGGATAGMAVATGRAVAVAAPVAALPAGEPPALTAPKTNAVAVAEAGVPLPPEQRLVLTNAVLWLTVSSWGGGVTAAEYLRYPATNLPGSAPLRLDFGAWPAMTCAGLPGFDTNSAFRLAVAPGGQSATLEAEANGVRLVRTIALGAGYVVNVSDLFTNRGAATADLPAYGLRLGPMGRLTGETDISGFSHLGIDSLQSVGGEGVVHWASSGFFAGKGGLAEAFQEPARRGAGCEMMKAAPTRLMPEAIDVRTNAEFDWIAVKNKFFVQLAMPDGGCVGADLRAARVATPQETAQNPASWPKAAVLQEVSAALRLAPLALKPGEAVQRDCRYYVGPKEYRTVRQMGSHADDIMEFGWFKPVCIALLYVLKAIVAVIPSFGIAIILVTLLVRGLFWPLTHKSTESMKKMQTLQPQLKALQAKYKDKPQKLHQETMALYRENKVNPMSGCLPIAIQIPVFIALYNVLRSAVELRYAHFLWVRDLSEAENLFAGAIPIIGSLNVLPLIMTGLSVWQTRLTPSSGDPSQQRTMMLMPVIMLVFFYKMPSALVLYWTANTAAMLIQLLWQRRKKT